MPTPCNILSTIMQGSNFRGGIGVRYQGDEDGAWGLRQSMQTMVSLNIRRVVDQEDPRISPAMYKNKSLWDKPLGNGQYAMLVGSFYAAYISEFTEMVISLSDIRPRRVDEMVDAARKISGSLLNTISNNNRSRQPLSLILCHAAQETTFNWQVTETDDTIRGIEGAYDPDSDRIDLGLFQIQRGTANGLGLGTFTYREIRDDPATNTMLATTYLQRMIDKYGNIRTGLGAYKAGETITNRRIKKRQSALSPEGQQYADEILECARRLEKLRRAGVTTAEE